MLLKIFFYYVVLITQCIHTFKINNQESVKSSEGNEKLRNKEKRFRRDPNKDVTNFDLADFINNGAANNRPYEYNYKKRNRPSIENNYSYLTDMDLGNKVANSLEFKDKRTDLNLDPSEYEDTVNNGDFDLNALSESRGFVLNDDESANKMRGHDDLLISRSDVHTTEKRCAFKEMKMPFFFHKKSTKSRKDKKRKICLNCKKNELPKSTKTLTTEKMKNKRSEEIKICPVCKSRLIVDSNIDTEKSAVTPKMIHNSRQYFAEILKKDNTKSLPNGEEEYYSDLSMIEENRKKRDSNEENNILKELDEVQKKVDNIEINVPSFEKRNLI